MNKKKEKEERNVKNVIIKIYEIVFCFKNKKKLVIKFIFEIMDLEWS